ncbi:MAG: ADP-ribosylglycohydrolase family protein [Pseudomonadales bacterium]|nr:ADP-ribosylglycohydrolase family protein [Pseudomonadales bacterium]
MVSDDTEHTLFVCQGLLCHPDSVKRFKRALAWKLRWWFLALPAGIGLGTARAIIKLWLFIPLSKSGVFTAGNGPAMRSAIIGARFYDDTSKINDFVKASTELTHTDPRALVGAAAISYAAALAVTSEKEQRPDVRPFFNSLRSLSSQEDKEWPALVDLIENALKDKLSVADFAMKMNLAKGVTGYIYHTVPVALYSWLHHYGDFKRTLTEVLNCGGDTDTVGAITGALAGATVGEDAIPAEWIENIMEWPRSVSLLRKVADALSTGNNSPSGSIKYFWPVVIVRNIFMLAVVFGHIFLRLIPARIRRFIRI